MTTAVDPRQCHPDCFVCSPQCPHGLQLRLVLDAQGDAVADFVCQRRYEGYPGLMHGGIISAVLDGAMTHCLFLQGRVAVTAELIVRFRHGVRVDAPARVRAWITRNEPPVFRLQSELLQDGVIKAVGHAAFMSPRPGRGGVEAVHA